VNDPDQIAITTSLLIHLQWIGGALDPSTLVNAVRDQDWLEP
jgi:hypothetical protein